MICWPNRRTPTPSRASCGFAWATPMMLRFGGIGVEAEQQVGRREVEEAERVRLDDLGEVHHPAQVGPGRRRLDREDLVARLGRGDQVADRADAADAGHDRGHLVDRATLDDPLEATELGDVELRVGHLAGVVEVDRDLGVALRSG